MQGVQGYLARNAKTPSPYDCIKAVCRGLLLGPRGGAFSYERGTHVGCRHECVRTVEEDVEGVVVHGHLEFQSISLILAVSPYTARL